jgi:hypothetical protein
MAVVFGRKGGSKDGIAVSMVDNHDVLVPTGGSEREAASVLSEEAAKRFHHDVEFT